MEDDDASIRYYDEKKERGIDIKGVAGGDDVMILN
jgi:hypothetical protein